MPDRAASQVIQLEGPIAQGGEGRIMTVAGQPSLVAKLYTAPPSNERQQKLEAMIRQPPADPTTHLGHRSICWPQSLVLQGGKCTGFLMPRVDLRRNKPLFHFYNCQSRNEVARGFTYEYLLRVGANIASVVASLHAAGYVIGDLNESNFMISDRALVALVDCDSMQVPRPDGRGYFRCVVGKPEYCAPELHGRDLGQIDRHVYQDNFALGMLIFQLLMEGMHPYSGVWIGEGDPSLFDRMRRGESAYGGSVRVLPSPASLPISILPATVKELLGRCLGAGHGQWPVASRPAASEWHHVLRQVAGQLQKCRVSTQHMYPRHLTRCPWCDRKERHGIDAFPAVGGAR